MGKRGRPAHPDILTPREWEVLGLLRERLTNEQIADRLGISLDGAKYHVSSILSKLGASTREEAAAWRATELRPWWTRLIAAPAPILGAATLLGATAGLALLAWGVIETSGPAQEVVEPTRPPAEDSIEQAWSPEERAAIEPVLEVMRLNPCNHPDVSTAKATLTTMDEFRFLLRQRLFPNEVIGPTETPWVAGTENLTPSSTPVWFVEVESGTYGRLPGDEETCVGESMAMLNLMLVVDGQATASWARVADRLLPTTR
jgi:DNA-binding CsgD family transcriptional regulator